ncbi:MAG TPA: hypothetical protein VMP03_03615 [Methylomirabilota bacterium]|nr:hypothetical protein [Methylomirabilota bacterium]
MSRTPSSEDPFKPTTAAGGNHQRKQPPRDDRKTEAETEAEEELDEALEDSFPASDPPSITQPVHKHDNDD